MIKIDTKKLHEDAVIPQFQKIGDVCADLYSVEQKTITAKDQEVIGIGIAMAIPEGYEAQIRPRSGLAAKHKITITNTPGTIDQGYRGEIKIILHNLSTRDYSVQKGDRIAQIAIREVPVINFNEVNKLPSSERSVDGLGSTGR